MSTCICSFCGRYFYAFQSIAVDANNNTYCPVCLSEYFKRHKYNLNDIMKEIHRRDLNKDEQN